jgi:hypothetical protein
MFEAAITLTVNAVQRRLTVDSRTSRPGSSR